VSELGLGNVWLFVVRVDPVMTSMCLSAHEIVVSGQTPSKIAT